MYNGKGQKVELNDYFNTTYYPSINLANPEKISADDNLIATTDFIPVVAGKYLYCEYAKDITINPDITVNALWFGYSRVLWYADTESNYKSYTDPEGDFRVEGVCKPVLIPEGAKYAKIQWNTRYGTTTDPEEFYRYFVGMYDDNTLSVAPWSFYSETGIVSSILKPQNATYTDEPPYKGKKWTLFGDSLTDAYGGKDWQKSTVAGDNPWTGYFFASRIAREFGLSIDNRAKSGSNINTASNGSYTDVNGCAMLDGLIAEVEAGTTEAPDYITVAFGGNGYASQLGAIDDTSENKETTAGAVRYFIEQIRTKFPNAVLGFVLNPMGSWKSEDGAPFPNTAKDIDATREMIKSVLDLPEYGGIPYIDMSTQSGITLDMLPDKIHISSKQANNLYYHAMRRFMLGL